MNTKEKLLQIAAELFRTKGYSATTVQDIAAALGIKAASLYNHMQSKQEVLQRLLLDIAEQFTAGMSEINQSQLETLDKLQYLIRLHLRLALNETDKCGLINTEWVHLEAESLQKFRQLKDQYEQDYIQIIQEGIQAGQLKAVNAEIAGFAMLSTLRWIHVWIKRNPGYSPINLERELTVNLLEGIKR